MPPLEYFKVDCGDSVGGGANGAGGADGPGSQTEKRGWQATCVEQARST